jgi:type I restriction enzyme S subunit
MDTKALRQKILDLAIRGKLVPQDPNDEPASVLLERICAEKQQMVKDGKLKAKDIKNDTVIFKGEDNLHYEKFADGTVKCIEEEIPFELPERWEWCRLGVITEIYGRIGFRGYTKDDLVEIGEGAITLSPSNIINSKLDFSSCTYISWVKYDESPEIQLAKNDIVLVKTGSSYGKSAIVDKLPEKTTLNPQFVVLKNTKINSSYACMYLQSTHSQNLFREFVVGTAIPTFSQKALSTLLISCPPISEQHRIVEKLNELLSFVDTIESDKTDLQKIIQQTKSKILDLAIRGKLVPQDPNDEPASVLLERIRTEKEELIKQGKIKRDKKESVIFKGEDNSYYLKIGNLTETLDDWRIDDIPDSWGVCCLGEVCDYGNCTNVDTKDIPETAWILDLEDIEKDTGKVLQKLTLKERNSASTKHSFHKGQVLYSKLRPYLNKVVLADDEGYCTSEILPLDFNDMVYPKYARYYLMSPTFLKYANYCSYGVKMPRLGTNDGKKAILTVPPLQEQHRIVNAIETIFAKLDEIANALS